jgi:hypothetical protein
MSEPKKTTSTTAGAAEPEVPNQAPQSALPLPGLAAIALYLLLLAATIVIGVVSGHHYPPLFLLFSALFITSSGGLLMRFRWAWALALAAVGLLAGYNFWIFSSRHTPAGLVQGSLNLVFFLYLVRAQVRETLR